jgi:hypothetical protein
MIKIVMTVSDLQKNLEKVIEEGLTVHITYDNLDEIVAVLVPFDEHTKYHKEIDGLKRIIQEMV